MCYTDWERSQYGFIIQKSAAQVNRQPEFLRCFVSEHVKLMMQGITNIGRLKPKLIVMEIGATVQYYCEYMV